MNAKNRIRCIKQDNHGFVVEYELYDGSKHETTIRDLINAKLDSLQQLAQVAEPVAWVRRHPDGTLTDEFLAHKAIETGRKNSGAWVPLGPIAAVPEDVLDLLGRAYAKLIKYGVENTDPLLMDELKLELMK